MFGVNSLKKTTIFARFLFCLAACCLSTNALAQLGQSTNELRQKAAQLMAAQKYTEALPLLEKLVVAEPNDPETQFYLGFALIAQANVTKDEDSRRALRIRARNSFIKSKELGIKEPVIDALIQNMPADGSISQPFSQNVEANKLMADAEGFFSQGKLDDALSNYKKALQLDPKIYEAALFSGDVHMQRGEFAEAESWYQKAIAIDPTRETAYRYSATPLMKQGKYDQARERFIEAYITEPYNKYSAAGLTQWAQVTKTSLAHPEINIPVNVTYNESGDVKIDLSADALLGGKADGSFAWISYGATRSAWRKERFAKALRQEKTYRHSLAEEADALRSVLALATSETQVKSLSPSLAKLKKLDDEGLLEAYILLARPDQGISMDHPAYLKQNRDKLRRYAVDYLVSSGSSSSSVPQLKSELD